MTPADIIRMAEEAGLRVPYWGEGEDPAIDPPHWAMPSPLPPLLERFAALVAAAEREACAKIAWNHEPDENGPIETAIRARGKSHD